jgi:hypothetical protein
MELDEDSPSTHKEYRGSGDIDYTYDHVTGFGRVENRVCTVSDANTPDVVQ